MIKMRSSGTLLLFLFVMTVSFAEMSEAGGANKETSHAGRNEEQIVSGFCRAWVHSDCKTMYQALSKSGLGKAGETDFRKTFQQYQSQGGNLQDFTLMETRKREDGALVKVAMQFRKEIPPGVVSGVHSFWLVNENGAMKIQFIIPPTSPPPIARIKTSGGSHPGAD